MSHQLSCCSAFLLSTSTNFLILIVVILTTNLINVGRNEKVVGVKVFIRCGPGSHLFLILIMKKFAFFFKNNKKGFGAGCYIEMALSYRQPHQHELVSG